jgi:hypothetical protein
MTSSRFDFNLNPAHTRGSSFSGKAGPRPSGITHARSSVVDDPDLVVCDSYAYEFPGEVRGRDMDEETWEYTPDEVFDSVTDEMLQRRSDYVPGSKRPAPYGEPLPYSPASAPALLSRALRTRGERLLPEQEQAFIRQAQQGDGEALLALISAYSSTLGPRSRRLAKQGGMSFNEAESWLLFRFTEAVMEFDCDAASEQARLAGSAAGGAARPLSFYLQDADWDDRLIAAPVTINRPTMSEFYAEQERAIVTSRAVDSMSEWLESTTRLSEALARQVAHLLTPQTLGEYDNVTSFNENVLTGLEPKRALAMAHLTQPTDTDDSAGAAHFRAAAEGILARLSEEDREMVRVLYGFDGEPVPHGLYGKQIGLSRTGVSSRLHRLIDRIREEVGTPTKPEEPRSPEPYMGRHLVKGDRAVALAKLPSTWRPSRRRLQAIYAESGESVAAVLKEAEAMATAHIRGRAANPTEVSVFKEWVALVACETTLEVCGE